MAKEKEGIYNSLRKKYKSFEQDITNDGIVTKITFYGSYEMCNKALEEDWKIGETYDNVGVLEHAHVSQQESDIYNLDLEFKRVEDGDMTAEGPAKSSLNVRMMGLPLERHRNYHKNWNNNLYSTYMGFESGNPLPSSDYINIWNDAVFDNDAIPANRRITSQVLENTNVALCGYYAWGKYDSDLPTLTENNKWYKVKSMLKPGVEFFDYPVYELTEYAKARNQAQAAWMLKRSAGKISRPLNGDFGVVARFGGNWLCEGGSTQWDGKYYNTQITYTHSPDALSGQGLNPIDGAFYNGVGWDEDIYENDKIPDEEPR